MKYGHGGLAIINKYTDEADELNMIVCALHDAEYLRMQESKRPLATGKVTPEHDGAAMIALAYKRLREKLEREYSNHNG